MTACLDSWAVLAWLDGMPPAHGRVDGIIDRAPVISWINLVEVLYRVEREHGRRDADETLAWARAGLTLDDPGPGRMVDAARLKAAHSMALADCFAVATAAAHGVPLLTGNPEIIGAPDLPCAVEDLRGT